jgi:hypothetical protein
LQGAIVGDFNFAAANLKHDLARPKGVTQTHRRLVAPFAAHTDIDAQKMCAVEL